MRNVRSIKETPSTKALFLQARLCAGDMDDPRYWESVTTLQHRASIEVWERAAALCESSKPTERMLGADVLSRFGNEVNQRGRAKYWRRSVPLLLRRLRHERDAQVLQSLIAALGGIADSRTLVLLMRFKRHASVMVRWHLACALIGHEEPLAIATLLEMTRDEAEMVRDWATFALGTQTELDTPTLREALAARLDDTDSDTHEEAIVGLARRGDRRALEPLLLQLEGGCSSTLFDAAAFLADPADPRLFELLQTLERDDLPSYWVDSYDHALEKCRPQ